MRKNRTSTTKGDRKRKRDAKTSLDRSIIDAYIPLPARPERRGDVEAMGLTFGAGQSGQGDADGVWSFPRVHERAWTAVNTKNRQLFRRTARVKYDFPRRKGWFLRVQNINIGLGHFKPESICC